SSFAPGQQLRDVPWEDSVGNGRRQLLLESRLPWPQVARDEPRREGGCARRCGETRCAGEARGSRQVGQGGENAELAGAAADRVVRCRRVGAPRTVSRAKTPVPSQEKAGVRRLFNVLASSATHIANTHFTSDLTSAALALTAGCPLAVVKLVSSLAAASGLPLYFAEISLNDGPIFLVSVAWQLRQPLLLASSS